MSRFTWSTATSDERAERWHVGWDHSLKTYFAQVEPLGPPAQAGGLSGARRLEDVVREGPDARAGQEEDTLMPGGSFGRVFTRAPEDPWDVSPARLVDVLGVTPGEIATVEQLNDELAGRVSIPEGLLTQLIGMQTLAHEIRSTICGAEVTTGSSVVGDYIAVRHPNHSEETMCLFALPHDDVHDIPVITNGLAIDVFVHIVSTVADETTVLEAAALPLPHLARITAAWVKGAPTSELAKIGVQRLRWWQPPNEDATDVDRDFASSTVYPTSTWRVQPHGSSRWTLNLIPERIIVQVEDFGVFPTRGHAMDAAERVESGHPSPAVPDPTVVRVRRGSDRSIAPVHRVPPLPPPHRSPPR
jgi:hypothetical protein